MHPDAHAGAMEWDRLLVQTALGDRESLSELAALSDPYLRSVCRGILRNTADADDAVQDVLVSVLRWASTYTPGRNAKAWIGAIARNTAAQACGRRRRWAAFVARQLRDPACRNEGGGAAGGHEELMERVRRAAERLPARLRVVLHARYAQGHTITQTAKDLNLPAGTVANRQRQAVLRLRQTLGVIPKEVKPPRGTGRLPRQSEMNNEEDDGSGA